MHACVLAILLPFMFSPAIGVAEELPSREVTAGVDLQDPSVIAHGLDVLNKACGGYCHGTNGGGFKAPSLRNRTDLAVTGLHATISYGRKRAGKMMPGWKGVIPESDIWSAVAAIVSLRTAPRDASQEAPKSQH